MKTLITKIRSQRHDAKIASSCADVERLLDHYRDLGYFKQ